MDELKKPKGPVQFSISLSDEQKLAKEQILKHPFNFVLGAAGSGKTGMAVQIALDQLFKKEVERIIITRPTISTEDNGFLPGTEAEKMEPWLVPIKSNMLSFYNKPDVLAKLETDKKIELVSLTHFRGRSQPLDCKVYTPDGFKFMGELNVGDDVLTPNNNISKILNIYPQGKLDTYEVIFSDNSSTRCSLDHLWGVYDKNKSSKFEKYEVLSLLEIMNKGLNNSEGCKRFRIPITKPVEFNNDYNFVIDPYIMGLLISDGCYSQTSMCLFTTGDKFLVEEIQRLLPYGGKINYKSKYDYNIIFPNQISNPFVQELKRLNMMGCKGNNKFIPNVYKYSSIENRIKLLRGLMDGDGSIFSDGNKNRMEFGTISETLKNDFIELVNSLGGGCFVYENTTNTTKLCKGGNLYYKINVKLDNINPFLLERKSSKYNPTEYWKAIKEIKYLGKQECQCISIDSSDSLYLTDNFIVTHNTFHNAVCIVDEFQNITKQQLMMAIGRLGKNSTMIFCGDSQQCDLKYKNDSAIHEIAKLRGCKWVFDVHLKDNHRHESVHEVLGLLSNV